MACWTVIEHDVIPSGGADYWAATDISDAYGALWCEVSGRGEASTTYGNFFIRFTQHSGSNPSWDSSADQYVNAVMSTDGGGSGSGVVYGYSSNLFYHVMYAPGSGTNNTSHKSNSFFVLPGYADSLAYKTILGQSHTEDTTSIPMFATVGTWRETSAIRGIKIFNWSGQISEESVFTLYGLETQIGQ